MDTLREQFIERLIREIFLKSGSGFVLKGGGAIQALFGAQRVTKDVDLDFTNPKRTAISLHNSVRRAIAGAARGLPVRDLNVSTPGKGEHSPRWKINFQDAAGRPFHVEIEVSRDARRAPPGVAVQKPFMPEYAKGIARFWVDIYDQPTLIATKLAALLGREVPRDVYDLDLLIAGSTPPSPEQVRWAIERADFSGSDVTEILRDRLDALSWNRFQTDLSDALPDYVADRIDAAEWASMRQRVGTYVEKLLDDVYGTPS
jgi:predicted nucleotidyltransferase component of viral defense system